RASFLWSFERSQPLSPTACNAAASSSSAVRRLRSATAGPSYDATMFGSIIAEQGECMNLPIGLPAGVSETTHEFSAVNIVLHDRLAVIATAHNVVDSAFEFDSRLARHAHSL